jgi:hypothetical protein
LGKSRNKSAAFAQLTLTQSFVRLRAVSASRAAIERMIENLEGYWHCPTPAELDGLSADDALSAVEYAAEANAQLARDIEADVTEWGKVAALRTNKRAKANKKAA